MGAGVTVWEWSWVVEIRVVGHRFKSKLLQVLATRETNLGTSHRYQQTRDIPPVTEVCPFQVVQVLDFGARSNGSDMVFQVARPFQVAQQADVGQGHPYRYQNDHMCVGFLMIPDMSILGTGHNFRNLRCPRSRGEL